VESLVNDPQLPLFAAQLGAAIAIAGCRNCNSFKGPSLSGRDIKTQKTVSLFNPRRHKWHYHFRWEGARLVGRTAMGRATVATLRINLDHRVAYREQLIDEGVFPPD
jgi:hypothetical protein